MNQVSVEYTSLNSSDIFSPTGGAGLKQFSSMNFGAPLGDLTLTNILIYIFIIAIIILVIIRIFSPNTLEGMSGGTLTQMYAQDAQNANMNSMSPGVGSGDFDLFWNQPTRVSAGTQRGTPLAQISLPNTDMNPKKNQNNKIKPDSPAFCTSENPQGCGNGSGNLNYIADGFVQPTDNPRPFVGLNGNLRYPDSYVGSMYISPQPDPLKPLPIMQSNVPKASKPYLPYVKEGYE